MATHDYVIANGTGAAVRSDLNGALAAIVSQNSSASAPATTYAYMLWADTTAGIMKMRNGANSAWISLWELDGTFIATDISLSAGTAGAPSLYFTGDTNTGIYSPGADTVALATAGSNRLHITSAGLVGIGSTSPVRKLHVAVAGSDPQLRLQDTSATESIWAAIEFNGDTNRQAFIGKAGSSDLLIVNDNASGALRFSTNATERGRFTSDGKFLVGTSSARANFFNSTFSPLVQFEGASNDGARLQSFTYGRAGDSDGPIFVLAKHRSSSVGGNTVVASGDHLGWLSFQGNDGTEFVEAAYIRAEVDGTPGANDMPGRLTFSTTADGASSPTERMRIQADGQIRVTNNNTNIVYVNTGANGTALCYFQTASAELGKIRINGAGVAYDTTSDYRLKENLEPIADATTRVQALKPWRFNFISHPEVTVDGFLAHEAQEVVPEAVGGTKDEEDADGNPVYQGIDQSKLVPLLTAALQEAIGEIESLKARVAALESA